MPNQSAINYHYYGSGHLSAIKYNDQLITEFSRDKLHREISRTQGNLTSQFNRDPVGRLTQQLATLESASKSAATSGEIIRRNYQYDRVGNLTESEDLRTGKTPYRYDKLGQIQLAGQELFHFDPTHNLIERETQRIENNQVTEYQGNHYRYDEFGNLSERRLAKPIEENSYTEHIEDLHYVVIGFEVNHPEVYEKLILTDDHDSSIEVEMPVHQVASDPGHTFMYLVKRQNATIFFSLGPMANDSLRLEEYRRENNMHLQEEIERMIGTNPQATLGYELGNTLQRAYGKGTPDYHIPEATKLFKLVIREEQYNELYQKMEIMREEVKNGKRYYNIFNNFTCASAVREILGDTIPNLPQGRSAVLVGSIHAINPYAFYEDMEKFVQGKLVSRKYELGENEKLWNVFLETIRRKKKHIDLIELRNE